MTTHHFVLGSIFIAWLALMITYPVAVPFFVLFNYAILRNRSQ